MQPGGAIALHWPVNQTQNKKNTIFLALLRLFFALKWTKKYFKATFEVNIQGGGLNRQKLKSQINKNFLKCPKINNEI